MKKELNARDINNLFYLLRYAIPRKSTAIYDVIDTIMENIKKIPTSEIPKMIEEIKSALKIGKVEMNCDKQKWVQLIINLDKELIRRKNIK